MESTRFFGLDRVKIDVIRMNRTSSTVLGGPVGVYHSRFKKIDSTRE
jgi:hypothetical protein